MSKGILNNRDKMIWDNTHKPDITDVVGVVDDEMDDLLEDHDDKVVDIVGDNMNDLLDAHDDKVVSIVGDNMSTLLTGAASTVQLIAGDHSGIGTTEAVKVGKWDATHDLYAQRFSGTLETTEASITLQLAIVSNLHMLVSANGVITTSDGLSYALIGAGTLALLVSTNTNAIRFILSPIFSGGSYEVIIYYAVTTPTP